MDFDISRKQLLALRSSATELLYGGAAYGGKSHFLRIAAIIIASSVPGVNVYLFRRTHPALWRNHMEGAASFPVLLKNYIKHGKVKWYGLSSTHGSYTWAWDNSSTIKLCHLQHERNLLDYQGADIHVLLLDEATLFPEPFIRFLRSTVRIGALKLQGIWKNLIPRIIYTTNPGNVSHAYLKGGFIIPSRDKPDGYQWKAPKDDGGMLREYVQAKVTDNPFVTQSYVDQLRGMGNPRLIKARLEGNWDYGVDGLAFEEVWYADKLMVAPFEIPLSWDIDYSFDWGSSAPYSFGIWGKADGKVGTLDGVVIPKDSLIRINELYGSTGKPNEGIREDPVDTGVRLREALQSTRLRYLDKLHVIKKGPADADIFMEARGTSVARQIAQGGVEFTVSNKGPGTRVLGCTVMRHMFGNAVDRRKDRPWLLAFKNCENFERTISQLVTDSKNPDDVDTNQEDHVYDESRYKVLENKAYVSSIQRVAGY